MPLRFVLDENLRGLLWRAIVRHNRTNAHTLDMLRVGDPPDLPTGSSDPEILLWTEREKRILVTFDKSTMPDHLARHLQAGRHSPGIFMLRQTSQVARVLDYLVLAAYASDAWEWHDRVQFIPD
jgi:hypothetical protein